MKAEEENKDMEQPDITSFEWDSDEDDDVTMLHASEQEEEPMAEESEKEETKEESSDLDFEEGSSSDKEEDDSSFFSNLAKELHKKGIFEEYDDEEFDGSEEGFLELQEKEVDRRVKEYFEGWGENMGEEGKALIRHLNAGGSVSDFQAVYGQQSFEGISIKDEANQKSLLRYYLASVEGKEEDEIEDMLEFYEESGKLQKNAEKVKQKLVQAQDNAKYQLAVEQEHRAQELQRQREEYVKDLSNIVRQSDEVKGVKLSSKDKKELINYMTKQSVKVGKQYVTGLQADLRRVMNDKEEFVLLAKMLKNDFDLSSIKKQATTEYTKSLRTALQKQKQTSVPKANSNKKRRSSLLDADFKF